LQTDEAYYHDIYPGYAIVAFDVRGVGGSGPLACPTVSNPFECAVSLGPVAAFYGTRQNAADIDAVRQALGFDRIALEGTSYGTEVALAYAADYPQHVERIILDSTTPPTGRDPFELNVWSSLPTGLAAMCANGVCAATTSDYARDVASLVNRLATKGVDGRVNTGEGFTPYGIDGANLLYLVLNSDLNPGLVAELPAAIAAARGGYAAPLLRLDFWDNFPVNAPEGTGFNGIVNVATKCNDGPFPWTPDTAPEDRASAVEAAIAALPAGATGPFGAWTTDFGVARYCQDWPFATGPGPIATASLPDVPVLILSGNEDLRTPTADAVEVAKLFPQAQVLVFGGIGHAVLSSTNCAANAVGDWLSTGRASACPHLPPYIPQVGRLASSLSSYTPWPGSFGLRGRTLAAAVTTVREGTALYITTYGSSVARAPGGIPGLVSGGLIAANGPQKSFSLQRYTDVPGVALSGRVVLLYQSSSESLLPIGTLTISGARTAKGKVRFERDGTVHVKWSRPAAKRR
jgi:pimeloyl-ACP methyl ester carboxylesterase